MKKTNKKIANTLKNIAEITADIAYGSASVWGMYQAKEPKRISKPKKK